MAWNVYYPVDFEAYENLSHKQFLPQVYYFMDGDVGSGGPNKIANLRWLSLQSYWILQTTTSNVVHQTEHWTEVRASFDKTLR